MICLTLEQLINSVDVLQKLSTAEVKARVAFNISKLLRASEAEISNFNETRLSLIKKYAKKDESGEIIMDNESNVTIEPDNIEVFNKELRELIATTVELNASKINLDDLNINITPNEMLLLEPFLEI